MNKKHTKPIKRSFSAKISENELKKALDSSLDGQENDFSQSLGEISEKPSDGDNSDIELSSGVPLEQPGVAEGDVDMVVEEDDDEFSSSSSSSSSSTTTVTTTITTTITTITTTTTIATIITTTVTTITATAAIITKITTIITTSSSSFDNEYVPRSSFDQLTDDLFPSLAALAYAAGFDPLPIELLWLLGDLEINPPIPIQAHESAPDRLPRRSQKFPGPLPPPPLRL